jgi:hypothetical protein
MKTLSPPQQGSVQEEQTSIYTEGADCTEVVEKDLQYWLQKGFIKLFRLVMQLSGFIQEFASLV